MSTEPTQECTVGIATQSPSGRVWGDPSSRYHVRPPEDNFCLRVALYTQVQTREYKHQTTLARKLEVGQGLPKASNSGKWPIYSSQGYISGPNG